MAECPIHPAPVPNQCPECGHGSNAPRGPLRDRLQYRCRRCGITYSRDVESFEELYQDIGGES